MLKQGKTTTFPQQGVSWPLSSRVHRHWQNPLDIKLKKH